MTRSLILVSLLVAGPAFAQAPEPVADPTGSLTGEIDGAAFELPVICETGEFDWLTARSHEIAYDSDPAAVDAAVTIAMPRGQLAVTALVNDRRYEFGVRGVESARQVEYAGTVSGKDGEYEVILSLDCDG